MKIDRKLKQKEVENYLGNSFLLILGGNSKASGVFFGGGWGGDNACCNVSALTNPND